MTDKTLGWGLIALGSGLMLNSLLGPLALGVIEYHLSPTLINQGIGLDAFSLLLVAPLLIACGMAVLRGSQVAVLISIAPALYLPYMFVQYIVGAEYTVYSGNNENFFVLHLALLSGGAFAGIRAWSLLPTAAHPAMSRRTERWAGAAVILIALFIFVGMYVSNGLFDALRDFPVWTRGAGREEYRDNPHMYWTVVMMDLGILVPAAFATGLALLHGGSQWAHKGICVVAGWLALVGPAVTVMGAVMLAKDDPTADWGKTVMFGFAASIFIALALRLYWLALMPSRQETKNPPTGADGAAGPRRRTQPQPRLAKELGTPWRHWHNGSAVYAQPVDAAKKRGWPRKAA